jgi:hypothetical protein
VDGAFAYDGQSLALIEASARQNPKPFGAIQQHVTS